MDRLDVEIQRVAADVRAMLNEYVSWGDEIGVGETQNVLYNDLIDFLNFRMETAETCVDLIERGKVGDALGLCRSLLENYLLFILMCRGRKYFRLQDRSDLSEGAFKKYLAAEQAKLTAELAAGTAGRLAVEKYPRAKKQIMHVFDGLKADDDPDLVVPIHYFYFRDFRPETMRLKQDEYFEYLSFEQDTLDALKTHQQQTAAVYRQYLSYDALLANLGLNDLIDRGVATRLEAHYTFLGHFLHPTHNAARELHEQTNYYLGRPAVGMHAPYSQTARLLAALYVCYLVAGLLDEIAHLHENAPAKFIADAGTTKLRSLTRAVPTTYPYFWFLFNDPPLYDKFLHCVSGLASGEVASCGSYADVPNDRIMLNQHIYSHLQDSLRSWANGAVGRYDSPLG